MLLPKANEVVPVAEEPTLCILSCIVIGEQPYKFVIYKSVIQSPDVFPVNVPPPVAPVTTLPLTSIPKLLVDVPVPIVPIFKLGTYTVLFVVPVKLLPPDITEFSINVVVSLYNILSSPPMIEEDLPL